MGRYFTRLSQATGPKGGCVWIPWSESLQQDVEALSRLDLSSPSCEQEARERIFPTLRRFNFDQRIRDECRALIRLLQFCGEDLSQSHGIDTANQLQALASIDAAIASAERG